MTQLFGHRWASQEGEITDATGKYTQRFLLWCQKTEHLSDEAWRRGFHLLEMRVKDSARQGETPWPPSYAEFIGLCDLQLNQAHKPFDRTTAIEDKVALQARKEHGHQQCAKLLAIFDE